MHLSEIIIRFNGRITRVLWPGCDQGLVSSESECTASRQLAGEVTRVLWPGCDQGLVSPSARPRASLPVNSRGTPGPRARTELRLDPVARIAGGHHHGRGRSRTLALQCQYGSESPSWSAVRAGTTGIAIAPRRTRRCLGPAAVSDLSSPRFRIGVTGTQAGTGRLPLPVTRHTEGDRDWPGT